MHRSVSAELEYLNVGSKLGDSWPPSQSPFLPSHFFPHDWRAEEEMRWLQWGWSRWCSVGKDPGSCAPCWCWWEFRGRCSISGLYSILCACRIVLGQELRSLLSTEGCGIWLLSQEGSWMYARFSRRDGECMLCWRWATLSVHVVGSPSHPLNKSYWRRTVTLIIVLQDVYLVDVYLFRGGRLETTWA